MSVSNKGGHGVSSVLPSSSDSSQVKAAQPSFQRGGGYTDSMAKTSKKKFPPAK
ncbi:MAG TPA: hypothetical protein VGF75_07135 [Candidatus Saccharimonadales bacterium]